MKRMLIVETIGKIRRMYHVQEKGFKTIAKELNLSKNTVKKIIKGNSTRQRYSRQKQGYRVLKDYKALLESKLEHDRDEPVRRRRTSKKLYDEISALGYRGSYEAVNHFVQAWKLNRESLKPSVFVPLEFPAGDAFQFDWSEEEIELAGSITRIKVAHIRLCHSRLFLLVAYPNEQLEMVMDAHDKAFEFFGGSCEKGIYDNMKTAVKKILLGKAREFNDRFEELASHHLFEPIACTPRSGWEKGQVENQVCTGRRNFFSPLVRVKCLDAFNEQLKQSCIQWAKTTQHPEQKAHTVWDIYQQEKAKLQAYQGAFNGYKLEPTTVSSTSLVKFDTNAYSVDCLYVRKAVEIRVSAKHITVYHQDTRIAEHARSFHRHQKIYNPWHYVPILERKPGALRHGAPFKDWRLPDALEKVRHALSKYTDGDKQFIQLLLQIKTEGLEAMNAACHKAISQGISQPAIIMDYLKNKNDDKKSSVSLSAELPLENPPSTDCDVYNQLYQKRVTPVQQGEDHAA